MLSWISLVGKMKLVMADHDVDDEVWNYKSEVGVVSEEVLS